MKYILLFLSCVFIKTAFSQDVYPLHPSVGDTIDLEEKLDYSLFPQAENTGFHYATIQYKDEGFVLVVEHKVIEENLETGEVTETTIPNTISLSQEEIIEEQKKIQKINAYYSYLKKEAAKPKQKPKKLEQKAPPLRIQGPMAEQMKKEARMKNRLKNDQKMMQEFEMGLRPRQLRIEFR